MKSLKNLILPAIAFAIIILSVSSCQRGYGCPYKMEAKTVLNK